jgi:arylsulfatase A-like enzyme
MGDAMVGELESKPEMKKLLLILLVVAGVGVGGAVERPNVVLILADDMGYADAGFNGGREVRTPHLDGLARGGAVLKSFYVQPVCSPTRAALMTGRWATRTGVYTVVRPHAPWGLKLEEQVMAQMLGSVGYETAICGKWHLGEFEAGYRPMRRGFDHQYGPWFGAIDYYTHKRGEVVDWHRDDEPSADEGYATELLVKEACRVIREKRSDKPLFLYLPFNAVHTPHQVPEGYVAGYPELKGVRRTYAGMLTAMDEAIGKVVAALEEKGMMDETLVIFASDNGGPSPGRVTSNGELRAGKGTVYEGGIRSCSFVHWRGRIRGGQTIRETLHAADWYPTLAKLTGAPLEQKLPLDGKDIWPVLTEGAKTPHEVLLVCGTRRGEAAVRMGDWKLVVGAGGKAKEGKVGVEELYNLAEDPGEKRDLAGERGEKVRELRARYEAMMEKAVPSGEVAGGLKE